MEKEPSALSAERWLMGHPIDPTMDAVDFARAAQELPGSMEQELSLLSRQRGHLGDAAVATLRARGWQVYRTPSGHPILRLSNAGNRTFPSPESFSYEALTAPVPTKNAPRMKPIPRLPLRLRDIIRGIDRDKW